MVVVPKKEGATCIHICVEIRPLNERVLRKVHPLPKIEETLAQLAGASVFGKVNANSGLLQIPLGLDGVLCLMGDIFIFRKNQKKHDETLKAAPDKILDKTSAITEVKPPTNVSELRRFMGMENQLRNS